MPNFAYINNKFVNFKSAKIHIEDRGLQFADSVYEVIAVLDNNLIDLDFHLKRLQYSLRELEIKFTINKKNLNKIFLNLIIINFKLKNIDQKKYNNMQTSNNNNSKKNFHSLFIKI